MGEPLKSANAKVKDADRLYHNGEPVKAKKKYQEAISDLKSVRQQAAKIKDDDFVDFLINVGIKPWWWLLVDLGVALGNGDKLTEMSRSQALRYLDQIITGVENKAKNVT